MNLFTSLPFELQDYIFYIDGRYKTAMKKTLYLIEEWGKTPVHGKYSWLESSPILLETERRAKMYSRHLKEDDVIRLRHRVIDATVGRKHGLRDLFKDVLGVYLITKKQRSILVDGEEYKSTKYHKCVVKLPYISPDELDLIGTTPKPNTAFVFNPATDIEVEVDGVDYYVRNGVDLISIDGRIVAAVDGDEAVWIR